MEIFDNRKADDLITWKEIEKGQVFIDTTETEYSSFYMKGDGAFFTSDCYVDLGDGTIYKYMGSEIVPRFKIVNAELHIND